MEAVACHWKGRCEVRNVRTTDEQVNEVFRRAALLRARAPAAQENPAGRMLFRAFLPSDPSAERQNQHDGGNQYSDVRITCVRGNRQPLCLDCRSIFPAGHPGRGLGVDRLVRWWKKRRIERYAQKWMGREECFPSSVRGLTKGVGRVLLQQFPRPLFSGIGLRRVLLFC